MVNTYHLLCHTDIEFFWIVPIQYLIQPTAPLPAKTLLNYPVPG